MVPCEQGPFDFSRSKGLFSRGSTVDELIGSLRNHGGDGNREVRKAIGLLRKTTTLHVHHALLYISLPSLHD